MSDPRERRPLPLSLDSHTDISDAQATHSSTISEVERATARALSLPPQPIVPDSSPEPSPSAVPGLDSETSTLSSAADPDSTNPLRNVFAARREHEQNESPSETTQNNTAQLSTQPADTSLDPSPLQSTSGQFYFQYEADAERTRLLRDAARLSQGLQNDTSEQFHQTPPSTPRLSNLTTPTLSTLSLANSASPVDNTQPSDDHQEHRTSAELFDADIAPAAQALTLHIGTQPYLPSSPVLYRRPESIDRNLVTPQVSAPQGINTESNEAELPPRPKPRAATTLDRIERSIRPLIRRSNGVVGEGTEMATVNQALVRHQTQWEGSVANMMQIPAQGQQQQGAGLQVQTQQVQRVHIPWWMWLGMSTIGFGFMLVILGSLTRFK